MPKNKKKTSMREGFEISDSRRGFMGRGFGEPNSYDPYKSIRENEEQEKPSLDIETQEDAWAGGENLVKPTDYAKTYHNLDTVREPEVMSLTESKLRAIIRDVLLAGQK